MSENFVFSSFKKPNRVTKTVVTKNAAVSLNASRNGVADKRGEI